MRGSRDILANCPALRHSVGDAGSVPPGFPDDLHCCHGGGFFRRNHFFGLRGRSHACRSRCTSPVTTLEPAERLRSLHVLLQLLLVRDLLIERVL